MPILDARHDLAHDVEGDGAWSESFYFNAYDPASRSGLFTRIGVRPNEGTVDVGMSVWLPDGDLAEYRHVREQHEAIDTVLEVGAVRYEMLEAMSSWRLTMDATARARPCGPNTSAAPRDVPIALDLTFEALTPGIGTDGQAGTGPRSDEARSAAGTVGKGHFEQSGRWSGAVVVDGTRLEWGLSALGNRDRSWGPRRWGGPRMWRWFSINVDDELHLGGIRLGTDAGDLHRGWVWADGRATSIAAWRVRTELDDDGLTQRVVHLEVEDKQGRRHSLRADVERVAVLGGPGGTLVNEGLARWTLLGTDGPERSGYGICEYLHQLDDAGRPVVPVE